MKVIRVLQTMPPDELRKAQNMAALSIVPDFGLIARFERVLIWDGSAWGVHGVDRYKRLRYCGRFGSLSRAIFAARQGD